MNRAQAAAVAFACPIFGLPERKCFSEHASLERWKRWQLAETQNVYIAQAESLMKRLLVVVDKETLAVNYLATSGRLASGWTAVEEAAQAELLL